MKSAHLIVVGKLKNKNLAAIEDDYLKRITNPKLLIHEVKARALDKESEAQAVLKKIESLSSNPFIITLTEFGAEFDSPKFSKWIDEKSLIHSSLFFVICGAEGPGESLLNKTNQKLSLSKLTYPHKLARLLFVEQFYRSQTIRDGHPYHN
jgi:23S rRNA (pseudouridine1915-N3)-methyltransferase